MSKANDIRAFDNTMLDAFLRCPRYYYFRHVLWLRGRGAKIAAQFGIAIHAALDEHYNGKSLKAMLKAFNKDFDIPGDKLRTPETGQSIVTFFHENYPLEDEPFEVLEVEKGFEIILGTDKYGKPLHYYGRIDLVANMPSYGILVVDHKTTTVMSDKYMDTKDPNRQFCGYIITADEYYENVYGAMLSAIGIPRQNKTKANPDPDIRREITTRNKFEKAEWVNETIHIISQIDACHEAGPEGGINIWPEHAPNACRKWNIPCSYMSLCKQKVPLQKVRIYSGEYEEKQWVPFQDQE